MLKLPNKVNEINSFKKEEKGCTLYSFSEKRTTTIICKLEDFEIDQDFCVDDKTINMIKLLEPQEIKIDKGLFIIKSKKGKYKTKLLEKTYKKIDFSNTKNITINKNILEIAKNFCSINSSKPVLNGVNFKNGEIVATDSYSCFRKITTDDSEYNFIVPREFIELICKEIETQEIKIAYNDVLCLVYDDNITYVSPLINGIFPDITNIYKLNVGSSILKFNYADFLDKYNIAKQVGLNLNKNIIITFTNDKMIAKGDDTFETDLINLGDKIDYNFSVTTDKFNLLINSINQYTEYLEINYHDTLNPLFYNEEIVILPVRC